MNNAITEVAKDADTVAVDYTKTQMRINDINGFLVSNWISTFALQPTNQSRSYT